MKIMIRAKTYGGVMLFDGARTARKRVTTKGGWLRRNHTVGEARKISVEIMAQTRKSARNPIKDSGWSRNL